MLYKTVIVKLYSHLESDFSTLERHAKAVLKIHTTWPWKYWNHILSKLRLFRLYDEPKTKIYVVLANVTQSIVLWGEGPLQ